ncbi:hypothetical protein Fleli_2484 [Bernardetia litoralis DSM 6794]|uniref:Uncharacterized protein n=1 Tax=Bernardetia litoralis (strain ATCC 23117 / DSM 6794 / NBRC 15988 / NCIMB 1366 / Fx l1 / Sio-4) TaxID=880071 RepID=I4ALL4_BERLS|nr:hypothetical protein [Bernardetia litoralis]AFM04849.1 hypothetical protein Fleli_2484 [Bernardetia litoralis DSM 6794]
MKKISINHIYYFALSICFALSSILLTGCSDSENERAVMWKFQNFEKVTYNFIQKTEINPILGLFSGFGITNVATGKLEIIPTSDQKADIALTDLNMGEMADLLTQNFTKENGKLPEMFVKGLKNNGTIEGEISEAMQLLYTGLLPIPTKDLKIGESIKMPIQMPMNAFGSKIIAKGHQNITLKSIEKNLYKFENDILIDEFDDKKDAEQKHQIKGKGEYIFDIEKGYFTKAEVEMKLKMKISDLQQGNNKNVVPDSIQNKLPFKMDFGNMEMNFISTVSLNLEKAE